MSAIFRLKERDVAARQGLAMALGALLFLASAGPTRGQSASSLENTVKAALLPKLALFVDWPATAFANTNAPVIIGILGKDPFGEKFDEALKGETARGRGFQVRRVKDTAEAVACHVLFISDSEKARLPVLFRALDGSQVLTVGDSDDFAESGGVAGFFKEQGKVRLKVNLDAARRAGLRFSSKLLQVSKIVVETPKSRN